MILRCPKCRKFLAEVKSPGVASLRLHCTCGTDNAVVLDHGKVNVFPIVAVKSERSTACRPR